MKKIFLLTALAVLLGVATATAQQISVVNGGSTTLYQNLPAAIEGASNGSVIYLPGGGFPLPDSVKITKKLTIIGIGHKSTNDNVDGFTTIAGNVFFNGGSDGSAIMGCLITGTVAIGHDGVSVNNVLVKRCNVNAVDSRANCENIVVSQNYIRNPSPIRGCGSLVTNNIVHSLYDMNSSTICYNLIRYRTCGSKGDYYTHYSALNEVDNSNIYNNIIIEANYIGAFCDFDQANRNMFINCNWGDSCVSLPGGTNWVDVFVKWNDGGINPMNDFHFKEAYQQYHDIGIYGNGVNGFDDHQTAPVPYITGKQIDQETDAAGQLGIKIRVKASGD